MDDRIVQDFWSRVDTSGECWIWKGPKLPKGYGLLRSLGQKGYAHRFAYEVSVGSIPEGMVVCHHCDNPPCVRPEHLFLGTAKDNARDMVAKGRLWFHRDPEGLRKLSGENGSNARLRWEDVREVRRLYAENGLFEREIAERFGISQVTVSAILRGQTWKDGSEPANPKAEDRRQLQARAKAQAGLAQRFWTKVDKSRGDDACWLWTAAQNGKGFGIIGGLRPTYAHRLSYELAHGPLPPHAAVQHTCGNRACVNPTHLRLYTDWGRGRKRDIARGVGRW